MSKVYLDANIFIYLSTKNSSFHNVCVNFIDYCKKNKIQIVTSAETFQEIIYYSQNIKKLPEGLETAENIKQISDEILSIDIIVIETYLKLVKIHKTAQSRDSLHVATCLQNKLDLIITYDKDFKKFKEIKVQTPEEFLEEKGIK